MALRRLLTTSRLLSAVTFAVVLSACTGSDTPEVAPTIRQTTEGMITGDLAAQAGFGELTPACPDVTVAGVGTTFECTAATADQQTLALSAVINEEGRVQLSTTNVINGNALPSFEAAAVEALNATVGSRLNPDAIDCGETTIVFPGEPVLVCALLDPHTEMVFDITLTISDIEARQFSLVVADQPRA